MDIEKDTPQYDEHGTQAVSGKDIPLEEVEMDIGWRSWMVVFAAAFSLIASTIGVVAFGFWQGAISATIGGADVSLWMIQSMFVLAAGTSLPVAIITDKVGRREIWLVTALVATVGCFVTASAKNMGQAIGGAFLLGFSFASTPVLYAAAAEVIPRRHRGTASALLGLGGYTGIFIAAVGGAAFIQNNPGGIPGWRSLFYLTGAIQGVAFIVTLVCYRPLPVSNPDNVPYIKRFFDFDIVGCVLQTSGLVLILMAMVWGGVIYPWDSAHVLGTLIVGIVMLMAFAGHQYWKKTGLLHRDMFQDKAVWYITFGTFAEGGVYSICINYFGAETGTLFEQRPLFIGLRYSLIPLGAVVTTPFIIFIAHRYRNMKIILMGGFLFFLIAEIGFMTVGPNDNAQLIAFSAILGLGSSGILAFLFSYPALLVPHKYIGAVIGLQLSTRSLGSSIIPAIAGAVLRNKLADNIPPAIVGAAVANGVPSESLPDFVGAIATGNAAGAAALPGVSPSAVAAGFHAFLSATAKGYMYCYACAIPFTVIAFTAMCFLPSLEKVMNRVVDRPVETLDHHILTKKRLAKSEQNR